MIFEKKVKCYNEIKLDSALMGHHRAPPKNWDDIKPKALEILNYSVSKYFLERFLTGTKFQALTISNAGVFIKRERQMVHLRNIGHSMNVLLDTTKSNFESQARFFSYLVHYDTLLQNLTDIIIKCDDSFITKCDSYYYRHRFYYKMIQSLQIATFITKRVDTFNDGDIVVFSFLILISKIVFL